MLVLHSIDQSVLNSYYYLCDFHITVKRPWTVTENQQIEEAFRKHIQLEVGTLPGKAEIEQFKTLHNINRPWKNIKDRVRHLALKRKK